jgi:hypothetical protein
MIFQAGIENNHEGRSIAWALEHPGCFAYGSNGPGATHNLEGALNAYAAWVYRHDPKTWLSFAESEVEVTINGSWDVYYINDDLDKSTEADGFSVNSFFPFDWKPLTSLEIERALKLLDWSRLDLLKLVEGLSPQKMDATYPAERWSIKGIIGHVGGAEWWYLQRLDLAFPREQLPEDPFERIKRVRKQLGLVLPKLEGVKRVVGVDGEFWSPRKILRRALWHERDHTEHIKKLL